MWWGERRWPPREWPPENLQWINPQQIFHNSRRNNLAKSCYDTTSEFQTNVGAWEWRLEGSILKFLHQNLWCQCCSTHHFGKSCQAVEHRHARDSSRDTTQSWGVTLEQASPCPFVLHTFTWWWVVCSLLTHNKHISPFMFNHTMQGVIAHDFHERQADGIRVSEFSIWTISSVFDLPPLLFQPTS